MKVYSTDVATWRCFTQLLGISGVGEMQDGPGCHSRWEDVVCRAPLEFGSQPTGPVGQTVSVNSRHPGVAATMVRCLVGPTDSRHFSAAASCQAVLRESGFDAPEWETYSYFFLSRSGHSHPGRVGCSRAGMAACCIVGCGGTFREHSGCPPCFSCSPGNAPLARRSSLWPPVHHFALVAAPAVRLSLVQGAPATPSPPSSPTVFPRLPVWPSIRLPWPFTVQVARGQGFLGGRDQVWPNPSLAKFGYQVWPNQVWPDQVWPRPSLARPSAGQSKKVRVSVKVSPAEGQRRLQTNTAYVRLSFQRAFMWSFECLGVWVFRGFKRFGVLGV